MTEVLDKVFFALSDATRRAILTHLAQGPATVGKLSAPFDISVPAIPRHMRVLESAGLLRRDIVGRVHRCSMQTDEMREAEQWLGTQRAFWEARLDSLDEWLMYQFMDKEFATQS